MATGFIRFYFSLLLLLSIGCPVDAADVTYVGSFGAKGAVIAVGGGAPKGIRIGQSHAGVTLIAVEGEKITVEVDGKRRVLQRGQTYSESGGGSDRQSVVLMAGAGGHFTAEGAINGGPIRFVVDTGASVVAIPASDANRLGIDWRKGQLAPIQTASGVSPSYRVRFNTVRVGAIELNNVEGVVMEGLSVALLGNTFLSRVEIRQESGRMTLQRRF